MPTETVLIATTDGTRPVVLETVPTALADALDVDIVETVEEQADAGEYAIRPFIPAVEVTFDAPVALDEIRRVLDTLEQEEDVTLTLPNDD